MVLAIPTDTIALRRTRVTPCDVLTVAESAQAVGPILGVVRRPAGEGCGGKAEREVREKVPVQAVSPRPWTAECVICRAFGR